MPFICAYVQNKMLNLVIKPSERYIATCTEQGCRTGLFWTGSGFGNSRVYHLPKMTFRHQGQSGTADKGLVRHCPAMHLPFKNPKQKSLFLETNSTHLGLETKGSVPASVIGFPLLWGILFIYTIISLRY
jgi:hypothetical protein